MVITLGFTSILLTYLGTRRIGDANITSTDVHETIVLPDQKTPKPGRLCDQLPNVGLERTLKLIMNRNADPCGDFYNFVCGKYKYDSTDIMAHVTQKIILAAATHLAETEVPATEQTPVQKAAGLYKSCIDVQVRTTKNTSPLRRFMKEMSLSLIDTDSVDALDRVVELSLLYQISPLLNIGVDGAYRDGAKRRIVIGIDPGQFKWYVETRKQGEDINAIYSKYMEAYGLVTGSPEAVDIIANVTVSEFHAALALHKSISFLGNRTISFFKIDALDLRAPKIPKGKLQAALLKYTGSTDEIIALLSSLAYLDGLYEFVGNSGLNLLLAWGTLRSLAPFSSTSVATIFGDQWRDHCFQTVSSLMPTASLYFFLSTTVPLESVEAATGMVHSIKDSLLNAAESLPSFMGSSKAAALHELRTMKTFIGYSSTPSSTTMFDERYQTYPDVGHSFLESLINMLRSNSEWRLKTRTNLEVHISNTKPHYYVVGKTVFVPPLVVQPPLFDRQGPDSLNYGGLGHMVAQVMMHALDPDDIQRDTQGRPFDWLVNLTRVRFVQRAVCLRSSKYGILATSRDERERVLASRDIADMVGLKSVFDAWQRLNDQKCLGGLPYSAAQLFFIASCMKWCSAQGVRPEVHEGARSRSPRDRCIFPLMNMKEFGSAFNCSSVSPMTREDWCPYV